MNLKQNIFTVSLLTLSLILVTYACYICYVIIYSADEFNAGFAVTGLIIFGLMDVVVATFWYIKIMDILHQVD